MNEISSEFFVATTAEDQRNYFFGEVQFRTSAFADKCEPPAPGTYRIIDGILCRIVSKLSREEVRDRLRTAARAIA